MTAGLRDTVGASCDGRDPVSSGGGKPSGNASAQQGADLLRLIEYRQRKSEPGKFAFVQMPHIHQGYNNCGSTACATFARFQGGTISGWDFKKLCPSPLGTGTDWWHLLDASAKIGQQWKLITFTPDDTGFDEATAMLKRELDAGRPVVVDFKYIGPQYPGGFAGHTLSVCGYIAAENLYILCNPAVATPGLQLISRFQLRLAVKSPGQPAYAVHHQQDDLRLSRPGQRFQVVERNHRSLHIGDSL